jgi:hypothetical protein
MKAFTLIVLIISILVLSGCGNSAKNVAQKFLSGIEKRDFSATKQYVTKESQAVVDVMKDNFDRMSAAEREANSWKYQITDVQLDANSATVNYDKSPLLWENGTGSDNKIESGKLKLTMENGNWKVILEPYSNM